MQFVDEQVGYVTVEGVNPDGGVLKTTDGGASWGGSSSALASTAFRLWRRTFAYGVGDRAYRWIV